MAISKNLADPLLSPLDDMVIVDDIDDILGVDKYNDDSLVGLKTKDDLLEIIDSIVYEVAESKATMVINSGLDKVVEYLNANGLSTKEIVEIAELRRTSRTQ